MRKVMLRFLMLLLPVAVCCSCGGNVSSAEREQVDTVPLLVMQIQKCSRLYTTEMHLHKIVVHNDTKVINGSILSQEFDIDLPLGTRKVAIPIHATVKAYVDFSGFSAKNIRRKNGKIEIVLPDPKISEPVTRIAHDEIKSYVPFLRRAFSDEELSDYEQRGRKAIIKDLPNLGIVELARTSAARTLIPMIEQLGYKEEDITITFRKEFSPSDIRKMLQQNTPEHD